MCRFSIIIWWSMRLALPRSLKVEGASGKHILKRSLEEILPHDLLYERKRGFGAPVREWFREGLGGWFDDHLMNSTMRRRDLLDYDFVSRMLDEHRRQTKRLGFSSLGVAEFEFVV